MKKERSNPSLKTKKAPAAKRSAARASAAARTSTASKRPARRKAAPASKPAKKNLQTAAAAAPRYPDLPFSYNDTKLVLLVRDPYWTYSYWDFSSATWKWVEEFRGRDAGARAKLRIHNVGQSNFYDLDVYLEAKNWYVELGHPDTTFEAELGLLDSFGKFYRIAKSNRVRTPRDKASDKIDPNWEPQSGYEEIYRLSGGGKTGHGSEIFSVFKRP